MNPYGTSARPTIDLIAVANWNAGINHARYDYHRGYVINANCDRCTNAATCGECKRRARNLLKVATSQDECATLLAIIDRPSPFAARCGTPSGATAHEQRGEDVCRDCKDARNAAQRQRRAARQEGAV